MTPAEERLYWIGWGFVAGHKLQDGRSTGHILAALVRAAPKPVRQDRFPMPVRGFYDRHTAKAHISDIRRAFGDLGLKVAIETRATFDGEPPFYAMSRAGSATLLEWVAGTCGG